jgi:hypothetical protein
MSSCGRGSKCETGEKLIKKKKAGQWVIWMNRRGVWIIVLLNI